MPTVTMTLEEYERLMQAFTEMDPVSSLINQGRLEASVGGVPPAPASKPKRKVSSYHKRLGREIKRLKKAHTLKSGKWARGWNQKRLMKTAHRNTK